MKTVGDHVCCTVSSITIWRPTSRGAKGIKVQLVAKKCLNARFQWLEGVLLAGIENCTIIIKTYTVCATGVTPMFLVV
jgi:hypothetical protein